jgi:hypothetical protein
MNKKNITPSFARTGMNKSVHFSALKPEEYTHAKNANFSNETGNGWLIQNEHSNILASKFKDGFSVVGYKNDIFLNRTFYFLSNPVTGFSEIGVITQNISFDDTNTTTNEHQEYTTLLNDDGELNDESNKCLNLSTRFPIKTIEIHNEKLGTIIYWTDNLNPPRYLNLDKLEEYKFTGQILCGEDLTEVTCVACDKLKMFKEPEVLELRPSEVVLGGRLKRGSYEFIAAYCDILGNEQSRFFSLTNSVNIFDEQENILQQSEIADETGYAIKIKANNLDTSFSHYKVVVIQKNDINSATTYIEEGIHSTSDDTILFDTDANKADYEMPLQLAQPAVKIERAQQLKEINNSLFLTGITNKKVPNLQKVVNLLGIYLQWQSFIAREDLYKDGVSSANYKGYFRDETYPLSIRFIKDGDYTPNYPLIGRPPTTEDLDVIDNRDSNSVNKQNFDEEGNVLDLGNQINKRWQLYNTATKNSGENPLLSNLTSSIFTESTTKVTIVLDLGELLSGSFTLSLEEGDDFTDLEGYLNENLQELLDTDPLDLDSGLNQVLALFRTSNYEGINALPDYSEIGDCDDAELESEEIDVQEIIPEGLTFEPRIFPIEYSKARMETTAACQLFDLNLDGSLKGFAKWSGRDRIFFRTQGVIVGDCINSTPLILIQDIGEATFPVDSFSYYPSVFTEGTTSSDPNEERMSEALTNKVASTQGAPVNSFDDVIFTNRVAKNAAWYEYIPQNKEDTFVLDFSRSFFKDRDNLGQTNYRLSIYSSCSNSEGPIFHNFFDYRLGTMLQFKKDGTDLIITDDKGKTETIQGIPSSYQIAVENGILTFIGDTLFAPDEQSSELLQVYTEPLPQPQFIALGSQGCFKISIFPERFKSVTVTYDKITSKKTQIWRALCSFSVFNLKQGSDPLSYENGQFAYVESTVNYPDNAELYNSKDLSISPEDFSEGTLTNTSTGFKDFFEENYTEGIVNNGEYILKDITDFRCKPIRHFRMPDNKISPFMSSNTIGSFAQSLVHPLGITVNEEVINDFLKIAVKNSLITEEERKAIKGYEILRGDRESEKSIVARGITFDLYKYTEKGRDVHYANYPFNSLGDDVMHYKDKDRDNFISHPYNSQENSNWTFHSPDTDYNSQNASASYLVVDGYIYGKSEGNMDVVRDHPKYTILGRKLKRLASTLATLEILAESLSQIADIVSRTWFVGGPGSTGGNFIAPIIGAGLSVFSSVLGSIFKYSRYKYQWLETFRDLGKRRDFANFYTAHGYYNYFKPNNSIEDNIRFLNINRGLNEGRFSFIDSVQGERLEVNNIDREKTTILATGSDHTIEYYPDYINYDNASGNRNTASKTYASADGICQSAKSDDIRSNVASMYVTLKNYLPAQYGTIGSIKWITTGYTGDLNKTKTEWFGIFGGDCYISRHTFRRGFPFFNTTAMNQADMQAFEYKFYANIGKEPRFYLNFGIDSEEREGGKLFPFQNSEYSLDCVDYSGSYVKEPSKFYLEYNGIPNFLVESTVNTNLRYGKPEPENNFFPNVGDKMEWTQPSTNPSRRGNTFFYNKNYSPSPLKLNKNVLPVNYNQEEYNKKSDMLNGTMYSLADNSENSDVNPWLIFRALNMYEFRTSYGKFTGMSELESGQVLVTFENTSVIFNAVDQIVDDGQNPQDQVLGTGAIFRRRPTTMSDTELGYRGSQSFQILGTPNGHIFVDAKRGQIFLKPLGQNGFEEISKSYGEERTNMEAWFKEQLPFKILEGIPNYDVDNPFNGVGITMGYDSRYNRIFITKKDYILENDNCIEYSETGGLVINGTDCEGTVSTNCPEGYTYDEDSQKCQGIAITNLCPTGFTYDSANKKCVKVETIQIVLPPTVVATPSSLTANEGEEFTISLSSPSEGDIEFYWEVQETGVTGASSGTGETIIQTLQGDGTAVYTINAYNNDTECEGEPIEVTVISNEVSDPDPETWSSFQSFEGRPEAGKCGTNTEDIYYEHNGSGALPAIGNLIRNITDEVLVGILFIKMPNTGYGFETDENSVVLGTYFCVP